MSYDEVTIVFTHCESFTGKWLYSEEYTYRKGMEEVVTQTTLLNKFSKIPLLGIISGLARVALAICHIAGHMFAGIVYKNSDHFIHAKKGLWELGRGLIEALPIIGRFFAWNISSHILLNTKEKYEACSVWGFKISSAAHLDRIDARLLKNFQLQEQFCKEYFDILVSLVNINRENIKAIRSNLLTNVEFRKKVNLVLDRCLCCHPKEFNEE